MKITDRVIKIEGVASASFNYDKKEINIVPFKDANIEMIKHSTMKIITDLQLQDSITTVNVLTDNHVKSAGDE